MPHLFIRVHEKIWADEPEETFATRKVNVAQIRYYGEHFIDFGDSTMQVRETEAELDLLVRIDAHIHSLTTN